MSYKESTIKKYFLRMQIDIGFFYKWKRTYNIQKRVSQGRIAGEESVSIKLIVISSNFLSDIMLHTFPFGICVYVMNPT